jgi:hypothetical protein
MVQQQLCNVLAAMIACSMQGCPATLQGEVGKAPEQLVVTRNELHSHQLQVLVWQGAMICDHPDERQLVVQEFKNNTLLWKQGCQQQ